MASPARYTVSDPFVTVRPPLRQSQQTAEDATEGEEPERIDPIEVPDVLDVPRDADGNELLPVVSTSVSPFPSTAELSPLGASEAGSSFYADQQGASSSRNKDRYFGRRSFPEFSKPFEPSTEMKAYRQQTTKRVVEKKKRPKASLLLETPTPPPEPNTEVPMPSPRHRGGSAASPTAAALSPIASSNSGASQPASLGPQCFLTTPPPPDPVILPPPIAMSSNTESLTDHVVAPPDFVLSDAGTAAEPPGLRVQPRWTDSSRRLPGWDFHSPAKEVALQRSIIGAAAGRRTMVTPTLPAALRRPTLEDIIGSP